MKKILLLLHLQVVVNCSVEHDCNCSEEYKISCSEEHKHMFGPVASNHGNLYVTLLALVLGRHGVPHTEVNGTE